MATIASADGVEIAFDVEGDGPPLVLLHGFSDARAFWREHGYSAAFVGDGRRVILIDARGHGESGKPHETDAYSVDHHAADVIAVLDALAIETADVLGYSMGGRTALGLACLFPERLGAVVAGGAHPYAQSMQFFRTAIEAGLASWVSIVENLAGRLSANMRERLMKNDEAALAAAVARDRPDISAMLRRSPTPVLLIAGQADPIYPLVERFARESNRRFAGLPGLNHIQTVFATDEVVRETSAFLAAGADCSRRG
jgi:pimeloyl-ACP methyl ester carboxylesterase